MGSNSNSFCLQQTLANQRSQLEVHPRGNLQTSDTLVKSKLDYNICYLSLSDYTTGHKVDAGPTLAIQMQQPRKATVVPPGRRKNAYTYFSRFPSYFWIMIPSQVIRPSLVCRTKYEMVKWWSLDLNNGQVRCLCHGVKSADLFFHCS